MSTPSIYAPAEVAPVAPPHQSEIAVPARFADFAEIVRRRRTLILAVASVVIAITFAILLLVPPHYVASATVVLEGRKNNVADQSAVLTALPTDPASLQNQIQILTSRDLADRVVRHLKLDQDPEFAPSAGVFGWLFGEDQSADATLRRHNLTVDKFLGRLSVDVIGLSSTIAVYFSSRDAAKAARIANALVDAYVASQVDAKVEAAQSATGWLQQRIRQLAAQVADAEGAVERYKAAHNLSDAPDGTPLVDQQVLAINTQLVQARAELAQKEANYAGTRALLASGHATDASQVVASPLIIQLRQQEADLARQVGQLATRYGPRHPKMLEIESQRRDLEAKIDEEVHRITGALANDVAAQRTEVASLEASLERVQKQSSSSAAARVELKALQANAQSTRTMYESFVTRLRETQDQTAIQMPDARIVSRASVPTSPAPPRRLYVLLASIPAGLLLGLLIALLAERFPLMRAPQPRMQTMAPPPPPPLAQAATSALPPPQPAVQAAATQPPPPPPGLPVLAEFPDLSQLGAAARIPAADYVIDHPASGFARAIAALDRQIATNRWHAPKVLAVTCGERTLARPTIALSLARAAAARGQRVLLIDADARWPVALPMARAKRARGGIAEVVVGAAPLNKSIARDARSNVMLLSWMARPARLKDLLSSLRMRQLMAHLRAACDLIIVDTPPVAEPEAGALIAYADAVLFVSGTNERDKTARERAIAALESMHAPTVGIALAS